MTDSSTTALPPVVPAGAAEVESALATAAAAEHADGHPPLSDQTRALLRRGGHELLLLARADDARSDEAAGAAVIVREGGDLLVELVVHPQHRRRGVGRALAEAAAGHLRAQHPDAVDQGGVVAWAHGTLPGSDRLARAHGLSPVRELRRMRLDAGQAPSSASEPPEGVRLRGFRPGQDDAAWLALNAAAFAEHPEQGSLTQQDLEDRMGEDWFEADGLLLAEREEDGALLGFHWTKHPAAAADEPAAARGPEGEVYAVGVSPQAQGTGLGRALTLAGVHRMLERGARRVLLYVDADNTAAVHLYERLGFVLDAADTQHRLARAD